MFETEYPGSKERNKTGPKPTDPRILELRGSFKKNPKRAKEIGYETEAEAKKKPPKLRVRDYVGIAERYARDVVEGRIPACNWIKIAAQNHLDDLARQGEEAFPYRFDAEKATKFCGTIERFPHIKGRWARVKERIHLQPWQCFATVVPFGWVRKRDGLRRFRKLYYQIPRKNAKSTWAAAVGNVLLMADNEEGAEVYSGATSEKQAHEVFGPARQMLLKAPEIAEEYGVEVFAKSITVPAKLSKFQPIIGKPGDGASPSCSIHDEYHEQDSSDQLDSMQTGMGARDQPILIIITTAGTNLASPCYDEYLTAIKVLQKVVDDAELFALIYTVDLPTKEEKGDDWTDPAALAKANPNMNVSVDEGFLLAQQREAILNPAKQNRFKTKHLNVWCNASVAGINMHSWKLAADEDLKIEEFEGEESIFALDLASKLDICSFVRLFTRMIEGERHYYFFARNYLPEDTIEEATHNQQAYQKWVATGRLIAVEGAEIDFDVVREDVKADAERFQVREVVYDPWRATQLAHQLAKDGATTVEMGQTAKNMGEAFDEFTSALKGGRVHHDGDPVMEWMASNVIAKEVAKGLTLPAKEKREQKIDGIVALVMAVARAMASDPDTGFDDFLSNPVVASG